MIYLISFANEKFKAAQQALELSTYKFGVDTVINYSPSSYSTTSFYIDNEQILNKEKGCGFWLWKPYIILDMLKKINEEDVLVYCDSGAKLIRDITPLINLCKKKERILLFENSPQHKNIQFIKKRTFEIMHAYTPEYMYHTTLTASYIVCTKNAFNLNFLNEWLQLCTKPELLLDSTMENESSEFIAHRHDQSILSILALKYNMELFRDPSQWGNDRKMFKYRRLFEFLESKKYNKEHIKYNSPYGQIFLQHRDGNYSK